MLRPLFAAMSLGAVVGSALAIGVLFAHADSGPTDIGIGNFVFTPKQLTVKPGTTVTWTNKDDIPHGIAWTKNVFTRSQALDTDDSYTLTFTTPGTYQYFCYLHPNMVGSIVVEGAAGGNAAQ
jgi:plastocyanin